MLNQNFDWVKIIYEYLFLGDAVTLYSTKYTFLAIISELYRTEQNMHIFRCSLMQMWAIGQMFLVGNQTQSSRCNTVLVYQRSTSNDVKNIFLTFLWILSITMLSWQPLFHSSLVIFIFLNSVSQICCSNWFWLEKLRATYTPSKPFLKRSPLVCKNFKFLIIIIFVETTTHFFWD